jgi:hypothetical protein
LDRSIANIARSERHHTSANKDTISCCEAARSESSPKAQAVSRCTSTLPQLGYHVLTFSLPTAETANASAAPSSSSNTANAQRMDRYSHDDSAGGGSGACAPKFTPLSEPMTAGTDAETDRSNFLHGELVALTQHFDINDEPQRSELYDSTYAWDYLETSFLQEVGLTKLH